MSLHKALSKSFGQAFTKAWKVFSLKNFAREPQLMTFSCGLVLHSLSDFASHGSGRGNIDRLQSGQWIYLVTTLHPFRLG